MNVQGDDEGVGVSMDEPIDINESDHEAGRAAIAVFVDSLQVLQYGDGGRSHSMEGVEAVAYMAGAAAAQLLELLGEAIYEAVVTSHQPVQHEGQYDEHSWGWLGRVIALGTGVGCEVAAR